MTTAGFFTEGLEGKHYGGVPVKMEGISFMELSDGEVSRNTGY
ncbi:MAG: hypothetical protein R3E73_10725 [Porticoccaceae bacterium]